MVGKINDAVGAARNLIQCIEIGKAAVVAAEVHTDVQLGTAHTFFGHGTEYLAHPTVYTVDDDVHTFNPSARIRSRSFASC